jgi:Mce-associated membrane protein
VVEPTSQVEPISVVEPGGALAPTVSEPPEPAPSSSSPESGGFDTLASLAAQPPETADALAAQPPETDATPPVVEPGGAPGADGVETTTPTDQGDPGLGALFDSRRATRVLIVLALVLAVVAGGLFSYRTVTGDDSGGSGHPDASATAPPPNGVIEVPKGRPVLISGADATDAVAAAAKAAQTILSASYKDFDKQVTDAASLMTPDFAKQFKQTKSDIRTSFIAAKTEVQVRIVAQGVVRANRAQVQALLFLNQYVTKDGKDTTYTPYRALVTVVHTDKGWLVSDLDTK